MALSIVNAGLIYHEAERPHSAPTRLHPAVFLRGSGEKNIDSEVSQISFHGNLETRFEDKETFSLQKDELEERRKENRLQRNKNGD